MVYVACPWSHPDPIVRAGRHRYATDYARRLVEDERVVYSPLTHSVPLDPSGDRDWEYWRQSDLAILALCDELHVLALPGWEESRGVQAEITEAMRLGILVRVVGVD